MQFVNILNKYQALLGSICGAFFGTIGAGMVAWYAIKKKNLHEQKISALFLINKITKFISEYESWQETILNQESEMCFKDRIKKFIILMNFSG